MAIDMNTDDVATDDMDRDVRALTRAMSVLDDIDLARGAEDLFIVVSDSGEQYLVDLRDRTCECPDHHYRNVRCIHIRRAEFATGRRPVPCWITRGLVDDQLGIHLDVDPVYEHDQLEA